MRLTLEYVSELIMKDEPDVMITSVEEEPGSGRGDNYTSMLYRVRAKGRKQQKSGESNDWECAIIYKVLPQSRERREAFKSELLFRNEVAFYTYVWPALNQLQMGDKKVFSAIPKVYVAKADIIAMEDLREKGFTMADRQKGLKLEHLKLVLKALAGYHALSLTLRETRPEEFLKLSSPKDGKGVQEVLFRSENEDWYRQYYHVAANNAIRMVSEGLPACMEHRREEIMQKLLAFLNENFFRTMSEIAAAQGPLTVFCHGDCWTNNFLFREQQDSDTDIFNHSDHKVLEIAIPRKETLLYMTIDKISKYLLFASEKYQFLLRKYVMVHARDFQENFQDFLKDVYLIDFQLSRVGSLALDLANLLYCCTSGEVRRTYMTQLLQHYHFHLLSSLHILNPEQPPKNPSVMWDLLNEEMRRCGRFGVGLALDILPISTCASDEAPDLYERAEANKGGRNTRAPPTPGAECTQLMTDLVLELIHNHAL